MTDQEKVEKYIFEYTAYDLEPLHLIISALISEELCESPKEVVDLLIGLVEKGLLMIFRHSGISGAEYIKLQKINSDELFTDVEKRVQFETYPEGVEFFLKQLTSGGKF